jgi:hypothetical protein
MEDSANPAADAASEPGEGEAAEQDPAKLLEAEMKKDAAAGKKP